MSLLRKIIFTAFVLSALCLGLLAYFYLKNSKKPSVEALSLMPDSCLVYLRSTDFFELDKKLNAQSLIADQLKWFGEISAVCNTLHVFDSLLRSNTLLYEEVKTNPLHFAVYPQLHWLAAFNVKRLGDQEQIGTSIAGLFRARAAEPGLFEFKLHGHSCFFELRSGVVLVSPDKELIAEARSGKKPRLCRNKCFIDFENTLEENALLSIYLDHDAYAANPMALRLNLCASAKSGVSAGAIDLQPSQVKVNGYFTPGRQELLNAFVDQQSQAADFADVLPLNTVSFKAYGFSSFLGLKLKLDKISGSPAAVFWKSVNDSALYNLEQEFYQNASGYCIDFETGAPVQGFVLLQVADTAMAALHLKAMCDSLLHDGPDSLYRLGRDAEQLKILSPLSDRPACYAARKGSCLYFSEGREALLLLLHSLNNGQLMSRNESFMAYSRQHFYDSFNYLVYAAPNQAPDKIADFFHFKTEAGKEPFENFRHFSFSLLRQGNKFKFRWQLMHETEKTEKDQSVLWTLKLDTTSAMKAAGFVNHSTGENELLLQDVLNTLYLVNAKGTVLWKKTLSEAIRSPLWMVDAFKNKKYQVLFSTANYLHLIDRNGNYLEGYPVKLPAEASAPLSLYDYDNTRDYRLFIACKNKLVYNYALSGVKQAGFVPFHTEHAVQLPVQYVKVGLSDYLVAVDTEGKIYTFSRRGEGRIGLKNKTVAGCTGFYMDATNNVNSTYLVYVDDKNNSINKISFADKKELVKLRNSVEGAGLHFARVEEGQHMDLIFTKPGTLLVYDLNGNLVLDKPVEGEPVESDVYRDESHALIMARNAAQQEIILFDQLQQKTLRYQASALPLISNLFNDHKKYLLITQGSQLSAVPLN